MWLVTGATGHIGNVLVRKLIERGEKVRVLTLPGESLESISGLEVEAAQGDVLNLDAVFESFRGIRGVFHLAGIISIMPGKNQFVRRVNVDGTKNILRAAKESGVEKLVYTSSIHAIKRVEDGVINESLPFDPNNHYGEYDRTKAEATLEVQKAAHSGLEAVIACPTGVIGPYDFRGSLMGDIIRTAAEEKPTLYVDGSYDFVDVRDVADGLIAAAKHGKRGESYILSGQRISVRYMLETVREITGGRFFQMKVPFDLAKFAALFMPMYYSLSHATPRFTPYSLEVLRSNANISHAKATRELEYQPRSLYESIRDTVKWFLERKK
ncbi:MAG TPA: SDR family oxidoreductase [Anaerolineales bacterium]|nr:SDR family oxidoreductase [Anaerolineales bacterium]HMR97770.1 SDR family oxidoreductase [Anaerolineales bacterium]HNQ93440.1 SDR family oxidoreductase [Anaerolineales bacterium]HNS59579.1 SDR family oxidoreductase [Anaerolineales bacterium]